MPTIEELVAQAKLAYRSGHTGEARDLLRSAVQRDPQHEDAWLWLSGMVDTLEEQRYCLQKVLALNPAHDRARQGLSTVERRLASAASQTMDARRDPNAPATSVEWGRADRPAVYGSGRQVTLPSDREYDAWVNELHLSRDTRSAQEQAAPFVADEPGPFGDTALMVDTGPFVEDALPGWQDDHSGDLDVWGGLGLGVRYAAPAPASPGRGERFADDDLADEWPDLSAPPRHQAEQPPSAPRHEFSFDEADEGVSYTGDPGPALSVPVPPATPPAPAPTPRPEPSPPGPEAFFAYIPAEIEAARGFSRRSLALALLAVLLVVANVAAVVALVGAL